MIPIARVYALDNGWLVKIEDGIAAYTYPDDALENGEDVAEAKAGVLWAINEALGVGTRYDPARVRVVVEPGDKHDDGRVQSS